MYNLKKLSSTLFLDYSSHYVVTLGTIPSLYSSIRISSKKEKIEKEKGFLFIIFILSVLLIISKEVIIAFSNTILINSTFFVNITLFHNFLIDYNTLGIYKM